MRIVTNRNEYDPTSFTDPEDYLPRSIENGPWQVADVGDVFVLLRADGSIFAEWIVTEDFMEMGGEHGYEVSFNGDSINFREDLGDVTWSEKGKCFERYLQEGEENELAFLRGGDNG